MEREIKFRAWDKKKNEMRTDFAMCPTSPSWSPHIIKHDEKLNTIIRSYQRELGDIIDGDYTALDWADWYGIEALIVMQYTGLKDKKGIEIFEGDIVKYYTEGRFPENEYPKRGITQVVWRGTGLDLEASNFGWEGEGTISWDDIEIIGNIYENPELLK